MKKLFLITQIALVFGLIGCAPSPSQLTKVLKDNPEIITEYIKAHPSKFMNAIKQAQVDASKADEKNFIVNLENKMKENFKNPLKPVVDDSYTSWGKKDAKITFVEYSDFLCYYCMKAASIVDTLQKEYGDDLRVVYKHLPFKGQTSMQAAMYFEAIAKDSVDKAKKFHDLLFQNQGKLKGGESVLKKYAKQVGASVSKIQKTIKNSDFQKRIQADLAEGRKFEMNGTPGFIINGVAINGAMPVPIFKKIIDHHLGKTKEFSLKEFMQPAAQ